MIRVGEGIKHFPDIEGRFMVNAGLRCRESPLELKIWTF